jgi:proton glutamate symport protein
MTSSKRILAGLAAGIAVGLFFGERAAMLDWAADGFVKLLQMTVLPYITVSIVTSLGRLDYAQARALGVRVGAVVVGLWVAALGFAFLVPLTFPTVENASFFSTSLVERRPPFDFVSLYIPANPFHSLAFNIVPAVVLFSVLLGVALIGVERKGTLLDVLSVVAEALAQAARFVARLTPLGLFAIAATAAGTMDVEQLGRLQIYLVSYVAVALLLSLWVLPGLIAALTPIPLGAVFRAAHGPLITAFVAGDLFIVLPSLIDASKTLLQRYGSAEVTTLPDVIVPASFNFPHTGKLLSLSFVPFAGWFADALVPISQYGQLALSGLVTFFGSLNAAVPFLLDLFRIPADTFQLFLATGVINARFGTLLAAVHTLTVAILGATAMTGLLTWNRRRLLRYVAVTIVASAVTIGGARVLFATALAPEYHRGEVLNAMHLLEDPTTLVVHRTAPALDEPGDLPTLEAIRARGSLLVGYLDDALPYAFFNRRGELVGHDIELAHRLARELGVTLQLMPVPRNDLSCRTTCDLIMSGVAVTTERASQVLFSTSYMDETLGLLVEDHARDRFRSWAAIAQSGTPTLGVPDVPYFEARVRALLPRAELRAVHDIDEVFADSMRFDAVVMPAERGSAWTLLHPRYTMVVPEGVVVKVPLAFPIARRDAAFATFINTWIELKRKDGTLERAFNYWILGQNAVPTRPRWAFARDVLGWMP